ncbi:MULTISPECIES: CBS domain-containing protein [Allobacillus]|nr:CBS domain-containing protein [Allobacillus salarius]
MPMLKEVMTDTVIAADATDSLTETAKEMKNNDIGDLPVLEGNKLKGVVTDRDIVIRGLAEGKNPENTEVREIMTSKVISASPDTDVHEGVQQMESHQVKRLFIVENDNLQGVVTTGDLARNPQTKDIVDEVQSAIKEEK